MISLVGAWYHWSMRGSMYAFVCFLLAFVSLSLVVMHNTLVYWPSGYRCTNIYHCNNINLSPFHTYSVLDATGQVQDSPFLNGWDSGCWSVNHVFPLHPSRSTTESLLLAHYSLYLDRAAAICWSMLCILIATWRCGSKGIVIGTQLWMSAT